MSHRQIKKMTSEKWFFSHPWWRIALSLTLSPYIWIEDRKPSLKSIFGYGPYSHVFQPKFLIGDIKIKHTFVVCFYKYLQIHYHDYQNIRSITLRKSLASFRTKWNTNSFEVKDAMFLINTFSILSVKINAELIIYKFWRKIENWH